MMTANRLKILREAASTHGSSCPGGYKRAWQDARHWWSAVDWLGAAGLVTRSQHVARITQEGREALQRIEATSSRRPG